MIYTYRYIWLDQLSNTTN